MPLTFSLGLGRLLLLATLALAMLLAGAWGGLALYIHSSPGLPAAAAAGAFSLACLVCASQVFTRRRARAVLAFAASFTVLMLWWDGLVPASDRNWAPDVSRVAQPRIEGDTLVVDNVRTFRWRTGEDADPSWETRRYPLSELTGVDLFLSYWAGEAIAHAIVSFQFGEGAPLAFSIEIRKEAGEAYSAIAGFFKSYEVAFIAADERDVVKVRATLRGEDVRLFRLAATPAGARKLLDAYVTEASDTARAPRWYNTVTSNCTTLIFTMARTFVPGIPTDWRVLFSGKLPGYLYDHRMVDTAIPLAELVERSHIGPRAAGPGDDPGFSARIREGVPKPVSPR